MIDIGLICLACAICMTFHSILTIFVVQALIVGAGTGNDVMAALRHDYGKIYFVDIDGTIIGFGRRMHPENPYDDK